MSNKLKWLAVALLGAALLAPTAFGHGNKPGSSTATIGGGEVKVDFVGPEAKGRDVLALLPPGGYWRMGADRATTFTTAVDLKFGDMTVPKGSYTLLAHFAEDKTWSLVVADGVTGGSPTKVVGKVAGTIEKLDKETNNMTIKLEGMGDKGKLTLEWGQARMTAEFSAA